LSPILIGPKLSQRSLILHDPEDNQVAVAHAQDLAKAWPLARLELLQGVGHYRILHAPQTIALVQDFLKQKN
jgi:predicted alpha/beta hydrolase family esterase